MDRYRIDIPVFDVLLVSFLLFQLTPIESKANNPEMMDDRGARGSPVSSG